MAHPRSLLLRAFGFLLIWGMWGSGGQAVPLSFRPGDLKPKGIRGALSGKPQKKKWVALTLDDGPRPPYTQEVLRLLASYNVPATFFLVGKEAKRYPHLVQEIVREGQTVGNHSFSHPNLTKLSAAQVRRELSRTSRIITAICGIEPIFFRPPYGSHNRTVDRIARELRLTTVLWNVTAFDFAGLSVNAIREKILTTIKPHSVILLHDGGGPRRPTVQALKVIIPTLQRRGFHFVTLYELMGLQRKVIY